MTFHQLSKKYNPNSKQYLKYVTKKILIHISKKINEDSDIFFERNSEIDFSEKKFTKLFNKVLIKNYPVEYLTKSIDFYGNNFYIRKNVFIPRQETEYLLDYLIKNDYVSNQNFTVLEFCSGSGCISNSLGIIYPNINIFAFEKKIIPFLVSLKNKKNFKVNSVKFYKKNIFNISNDFLEKANLIICNPPYISKDEYVPKNVLKEPKKALFAKDDGLYFYKNILKKYYPLVKKNSFFAFEIGYKQKDKLIGFLEEIKINDFSFLKDMDGNYRILLVKKR